MTDALKIPLWQQILRGIESDISKGVLVAGERLPPEPQLAARFGAHRHTVRRAMQELVHRGLVRIEHGRGSFVNDHVIDYSISRRTRLEENLLKHHLSFKGELLSTYAGLPEADVAAALGLQGGERVVVVEALNVANGLAMSVVRHTLPESRFPAFADAYRACGGSVTAALGACGVRDFTRAFTRVSTRLPTDQEARWLMQPRSVPVLITESIEVDSEGVPIKHGLARFAGDRVQLTLES